MRKLNELHDKYADKGLRIFGAYWQFQSFATIEKHLADFKIKYPVALEGFFDSRFEAPLLCHVFVIGVDGKMLHISTDKWVEAIEAELKKVVYPGLGLTKVDALNEPAAKAFGAGRYAEAYKLAEAVADGDHPEAVLKEAAYIMERIEGRRDRIINRAEMCEITKRYDVAAACWDELAAHYTGLEDVEEPAKQAERIRGLKEFKPEAEARRQYLILRTAACAAVENARGDKPLAAALRAHAAKLAEFAAKNEGLSAATDALELVDYYGTWADQLDPPAEPAPDKPTETPKPDGTPKPDEAPKPAETPKSEPAPNK
ncbi:MAG: hypothetical protein IT463_08825 [Planctomycetes bacterium]|nr:hypothetical protein [Planctomycetota bacterium]